jgi:hypothetical protein
MIGRYYDAWGSKQNITNRFGDNYGNPFQGPIQITYYDNNRMFILSKNQVISLQNTMDNIEFHLCPIDQQDFFEDQLFQQEITADDWRKRFLSSSLNDDNNSLSNRRQNTQTQQTYTVYLDIKPTAISCIMNPPSGKDFLYIMDERQVVKVYDLLSQQIITSFGRTGLNIGEFSGLSALHAFAIGNQTFVMIGDSGSNQRVNFFTSSGDYLASVGGKGPLLGQFRDISSISVYIEPSLQDRNIDFFSQEYLPSWYQGNGNPLMNHASYTRDDLYDILCNESYLNNFVIDKDHLKENCFVIYYINRYDKKMNKLSIRYGEVLYKDGRAIPLVGSSITMGKKPGTPKAVRPLSSSGTGLKGGKKQPSSLQEEEGEVVETIRKIGFYLIEPERVDDGGELLKVFDSLYDLVRYRKDLFILREEVRPSFITAICDRKNFRVQILRCFFTSHPFLYSPLLLPIDIIGGIKNHYLTLYDPIDVSYTKGGELAICDNGRNQVVLLSSSGNYDVIKVIRATYLSMKDLQFENLKKEKEAKEQEEEEGLAGTFRKKGKNSVTENDDDNDENNEKKKIDFKESKTFDLSMFSGQLMTKEEEKREKEKGKKAALSRENSGKGGMNNFRRKNILTPLELENTKKPCSVSFNENGNMALGFKSGGNFSSLRVFFS